MSERRVRTIWGFSGPPDSVLDGGCRPRRPFSVVRYWLPGVAAGVLVLGIGGSFALLRREWLWAVPTVAAAVAVPIGYGIPIPRGLGLVAAVATAVCAALGCVLATMWGFYGTLVAAATWALTLPAAVMGMALGLTLRDVARGRLYHGRFLPLVVAALILR